MRAVYFPCSLLTVVSNQLSFSLHSFIPFLLVTCEHFSFVTQESVAVDQTKAGTDHFAFP